MAAAHLFMTEGFERTSMDAIAAHAGVSKQTVYSHFSNKDELFRYVIFGKVEEYQLLLDNAESLGFEEGLARLGNGYLELISDERAICMWRLLIGGAMTHRYMANAFYETGPGATRASLARFLRVNADKISTDDYDAAANTFIALVMSQHQMKIMLGLAEGVTPSERKSQVGKAVQQFLTLYTN
ncbi:MAG: TetR/AcrR family transcriptional regulator [Woeseiaceae bacterium]|nr:TetR/AcrR family transcriptional regulator [Woeseiaceae bacterium]